ncbi:glycosyltransferase family 2 protein [Spectribacter hydrogenoxidans]|uniref:Glycosyltransferase family 2 protein n=1 Tax=Spectribacter hydrogenoxidans TaxID=3075608 RepID=A0ABU3C0B5_9GAMM|nr:glycosyltransferase family 2 protein [Salinisphaera sp. W335]MDT0635013.1 glycosyltransferase family 2 protein [Salinisphaera sp. W335]
MKAPRHAYPYEATPGSAAVAGPLPLACAVITRDEADNIGRCLASVAGLVREIVVVDSGSTDATCEIAREYGARVIHRDWTGFAAQKQFAMDQCSQPWLLSLDADEALEPAARAAIEALFAGDSEPAHAGYEINRLTWYLGDWVRHTWYPEWRLRLVRRDRAAWRDYNGHDYLAVDGEVARLGGHLLHYSYRNLEHHMQQSIHYARMSGLQLAQGDRRIPISKLFFSPLGRFIRLYLLKQGWRDGWRGVLLAFSSVMSGFLKYAFALEARQARDSAKTPPDGDS